MTEGTVSLADRTLLERATELGRRGWGRVHPNPMVGCVLARGGEVVGEGWHREFGGPHAEIHALEAAGESARGATAYVSLEPCRHEGKTPACTSALVRAGVSRVVFGGADPTHEAGGGAGELRGAGIEVVGPLFTVARARRENAAFFHRATSELPWLALKLAVSLDGRIAAAVGERTTLTGEEAHAAVHRLRAGFDGILVGSATARTDDPLLTVRGEVPPRRAPARLVLDSHARLPLGARLLEGGDRAPVVVFTRRDASEAAMEALEAAGATVHPVPGDGRGDEGGVDLDSVLEVCVATGVGTILCEGGGRLGRSLLSADLVERLHLFVAPRILGEDGVPAFPGAGDAWADFPEEGGWSLLAPPGVHGDDVEIVYERRRPWSHGEGDALLWSPVTPPPGADTPGGG